MIKLAKLTDYSTVILGHMAKTPDQIFSARKLSEKAHIRTPTVQKILKTLVQAALVISHRGQHGGYQLSRPPVEISILDIVNSMEGPLGLTECHRQKHICSLEQVCHIRKKWQLINEALACLLQELTLLDLVSPQQNYQFQLTRHLPTPGMTNAKL